MIFDWIGRFILIYLVYFYFDYFILLSLFYFVFFNLNITFCILICQLWILYSEDYFNSIAETVNVALQLITAWKGIPLSILFYYLLLNGGITITFISIKVFITVTIMIGNIIDIYLLGIIVILINWILFCSYFGFTITALLLYIFLTKIELFLVILYIMESFSSLFQSLTLSNRLSINIGAGSLLVTLLSIAVIIPIKVIFINSLLIIPLVLLYSFEILNSFVQLFTFNLSTIEYSLEWQN